MMAELDLLNGFAGKVISDCIDITINAIKKADKNRKAENQTMEARIYQVTIDVLNKFPYSKLKKEEKVYDVAENILKGFKNEIVYKEAVRPGLKIIVSQVTDDICNFFLENLCYEICRDENDDLYKEIALRQWIKMNENLKKDFGDNNRSHEETHNRLDYAIEGIDYIRENMNEQKSEKSQGLGKIPIENRAEEYACRWDKNVFLNNFKKRDRNKGVNIKLKEIYLEEHLPHYVWKRYSTISYDLKSLLSEYIADNYVINNDDNNGKKMLVILGQAGIGKSTLITWIMANFVEKKEYIYVYQFASDLKGVNWHGGDILNSIFKNLKLKYDELENKILILDGFDEIYVSNNRERVLDKLEQELTKMNFLKKFSLIITCRENYVDISDMVKYDYITLQAWDEKQIKSFCQIYEEKSEKENLEYKSKISETKINKIVEKREVFGIPLILYMVLALNVTIEKSSSIVDVYDQIFSVQKGVIYNRCYDIEHRINEPKIKEYIYKISLRIAFWIFENNSEKAFIFQRNFKEICDGIIDEVEERKKEDIQSDVLIGNYFKLIKHCEGIGTDELQFAHRSIYEYFVAIYFFESLHVLTSKEDMAGEIGFLLKDGKLSKQILEFMKYKFDSVEEYHFTNRVKESFVIMLRNGMTFYTKERLTDILNREMNIFLNMLEVMYKWNFELEEFECIETSYVQYNRKKNLHLRGIKLKGADLSRVYLYRANLEKINLERALLEGANLEEAILENVNLKGANLKDADLESATLEGVNLEGANLKRVNLERAKIRDVNLEGANMKRANLKGTNWKNENLKKVYLGGAILEGASLENVNLEGANLKGANLKEANLVGALLNKVDLKGTNLKETIFDEKQVELLYQTFNLYGCRVYLFETKAIISYKEYCVKNQKV